MKRSYLTGVFVLVFAAGAWAQGPPQTQPTPNQAEEMRMQRAREAEARRMDEQGMARLWAIRQQLYRGKLVPRAIIKDVSELYRSPTAKELKKLEPSAEDLVKYKMFLGQKKTGIVRLVQDAGCGDSTKTVSAAADCIKYPMPGHGSWYSFRERNYRLGRLADLGFGNGNFITSGVRQHGILTGLGDVPLADVRLDTKGLSYLNDFRPVDKLSEALKIENELKKPVHKDGFLYAQELRAVESMTYVLRSVAYRGNLYRSIEGNVYDELDFDKRQDITTAFRIVRRHDDRSITVLWKELARKSAPILKREKGDPRKIDSGRFVADGIQPFGTKLN